MERSPEDNQPNHTWGHKIRVFLGGVSIGAGFQMIGESIRTAMRPIPPIYRMSESDYQAVKAEMARMDAESTTRPMQVTESNLEDVARRFGQAIHNIDEASQTVISKQQEPREE